MSRHLVVLALFAVALSLIAASAAGRSDNPAERPAARTPATDSALAADSSQIERGRYLVTGVAMCGECHTPRTTSGEPQMHLWLKGAPIPLTTPEGYATWAYKAPRIAGLPQHKDGEFLVLMTSGVNRDGQRPRSPMPQFRMAVEDAQAIEAYLRSLD